MPEILFTEQCHRQVLVISMVYFITNVQYSSADVLVL